MNIAAQSCYRLRAHVQCQVGKDAPRLLWLNLRGLKSLCTALQNVFSIAQKASLWMPTDADKLAKANAELKKVIIQMTKHYYDVFLIIEAGFRCGCATYRHRHY